MMRKGSCIHLVFEHKTCHYCIVGYIFISILQENMSRMLMVTDVQDIIKRHQAQIITSLKDPDIRLTLSLCRITHYIRSSSVARLLNKDIYSKKNVGIVKLI